jgi:hypothetical protein
MITFRRYVNNEDHCWYDSSNVVYSVCFDTQDDEPRDVKVVFKGGRTYLYKGVEPSDYVMFRDAESQGKSFNQYIKNHDCERLEDTPLDELEAMRLDFQEMEGVSDGRVFELEVDNGTGAFRINYSGKTLFSGIEGQVSVINLFTALGLPYTINECEVKLPTTEEFDAKKITEQ